jgi:hypothetical protein
MRVPSNQNFLMLCNAISLKGKKSKVMLDNDNVRQKRRVRQVRQVSQVRKECQFRLFKKSKTSKNFFYRHSSLAEPHFRLKTIDSPNAKSVSSSFCADRRGSFSTTCE